MEMNKTWSITHLSNGIKQISCKWLFKLKLNSNGTIAKHKARLVARGFTQQYGLDFQETFSPVAKIMTLRLLLSLAASQHWNLAQLDVNNAFLNDNLDEKIFMSLQNTAITPFPHPQPL
uniref:Retrovirus-related Pol polyprotein from transposon TNT 1-94 n=1 Tax=Cajanus cajan TaxID=3821 RepID=A0A151TPJ3_CAJCA|nr:Retrovirus-related Pol polyprotein from transposon TNT 1-94 [Cajanus cajan]